MMMVTVKVVYMLTDSLGFCDGCITVDMDALNDDCKGCVYVNR